jgi:hypothetical protein
MSENSSLDPQLEEAVKNAVGPQLVTAAAVYGAAIVAGGIAAMIGINYKSSTMAGDVGIHPTNNDTSISKVETSAAAADGKIAQDTLAGVNGELKASETEARALTSEATAVTSGAAALRTKAGASDIEVKALKMT